eukprot:TRINITY_DN19798_c0_g1_i2.p1 TRINITY_DN19798_c0_g1~~TRINITY_DN19798_c0_g1_i2.p1  ORF type:complete len:639 (-),score=113.12 TRINITY_DN19798_c0_g1_i2:148-2064(-)
MAMAQQNMCELQRAAIRKMLSIGADGGGNAAQSEAMWKVLVYDKYCQEIVAPLLKIGALRKQNVTLNQMIGTERSPVPDVPAVYFVEPTEQNIKRICEDLGKGLYESCYINFASSVPRSLLEELARGAMQANAAQKVIGVFDRYVSFVSLSASLFSLNLPGAYETIYSPLADQIVPQYIERIVDGLLSVLITMKSLPIIRCPTNGAAEMVGRRLDERIRELLNRGGSAAAELFTGGGPGARPDAAAASGRPLLCILDRDVDLVTMLGHTWQYQAMCHDVLGMRLNQLNVAVDEGGAPGAPPKPKVYSLDDSDAFWTAHAGDPFPVAAGAVHESLESFNKKRAEMTKAGEGEDPDAALAPGLAAAINALPEMTEKKRSIDMHINIASALVAEIRARELDRYYEMEDQFASQSLSTSISALEAIIADPQKGTLVDKTRALMVLYLSKPSISEAQLTGLLDALKSAGGDASGFAHLKNLAQMRSMMMPAPGATTGGGAGGAASLLGGGLSSFGSIADKMRAHGEGLLAAGMSNIKNIVTSKKELMICKIMDELVDHKTGGVTENYLYLDPKAAPVAYGAEPTRIRAPFRRAMAFVVGGGNYVELQSLAEWAQASNRHISYGSTDIVSPSQFVDELGNLGQN